MIGSTDPGSSAGPAGPQGGGAGVAWQERTTALLRIAEAYSSGVRLRDLVRSIPDDGPRDPELLGAWIRDTLHDRRVAEGFVYPAAWSDGLRRARDLERRAERYVEAAQHGFLGGLGRELRWVRCVAVTGSAAFGGAREGDDCDLLLVTRRAAVWVVLAAVFLRHRLRRARGGGDDPRWCLNFVVDERSAAREFARYRGYHVAREALSAKVVLGAEYYAGLLRRAPWMGEELPRLYAERSRGVPDAEPSSEPLPRLVRALNPVLCLVLGGYLAAVGLVRDHRHRHGGRPEKAFRTRVGLGSLVYESDEFDALLERYRSPAAGRSASS